MKTKKKSTAKEMTAEPDWKAIALHLGQQVNFAITYLSPKSGSGLILNTNTGETQNWKERFADALERIPGVKVDREAMHALSLPARERRKFFKDRKTAAKEAK